MNFGKGAMIGGEKDIFAGDGVAAFAGFGIAHGAGKFGKGGEEIAEAFGTAVGGGKGLNAGEGDDADDGEDEEGDAEADVDFFPGAKEIFGSVVGRCGGSEAGLEIEGEDGAGEEEKTESGVDGHRGEAGGAIECGNAVEITDDGDESHEASDDGDTFGDDAGGDVIEARDVESDAKECEKQGGVGSDSIGTDGDIDVGGCANFEIVEELIDVQVRAAEAANEVDYSEEGDEESVGLGNEKEGARES